MNTPTKTKVYNLVILDKSGSMESIRTEAIKTLSLKKEIEILDSKGIIHGIRSQNHLDEAASAYKNIDELMANQQDLVKTITKLSPLAVVKG